MVLKLAIAKLRKERGLAEDKITWYSNQVSCLSLSLLGLEEDKITWYSNSCCYRSTRFGEEKAAWYSNRIFLMCRWISSLEGWLQDSQTSTLRGCAGLMAWRGIELQGSQIFCEGGNGVHAIGKGIELQGAQTTPPSEANKAMFWKRKNCRVLKRVCGRADNVLWFGRR